ncbi:hypothetical protein BZG36_00662 [Bifiguratus adelaidae]|uniref:Actin-related protein 4 n=1 Tax=Bifiguratus adelaidae TaxID=1938954 RepID=A0A261Y739_9FUNG|nr:hypothetical protein BZG36_00662 [Bifiguratus adelaidae]
MVTYGGDEVSAVVIDVGSAWTRAGYAGEDTPKALFPSAVGIVEGQGTIGAANGASGDGDVTMGDASGTIEITSKKFYVGDNEMNTWRAQMDIKYPVKEGIVQDWELYEQLWSYAFNNKLRIDPAEHPLLCTEPAWNPPENREKLTELAFEKFGFSAFYLAKDAVMTAFAVGKSTALVLDTGSSVTSVVPVYDGYVLKKGIAKESLAGDFISEQLKEQLKQELGIDIVPQYKVASKTAVKAGKAPEYQVREREGTTDSYHEYQQARVLQEFKESVCQVSEMPYDEHTLSVRPQKTFEFPNGYNNNFGVQRFRVPETMFNPQHIIKQPADEQFNPISYSRLVYQSMSHCDIDLRPLLLNNVVVTGGNSLWQGFNERLNHDLPQLAPGSKVKIHAAGNPIERKCSSWLGGSILSSLGTFHQLWISKKEYDEIGPSIVERKCQ